MVKNTTWLLECLITSAVSVEDIKRLQVRNKYDKLMFLDALVEITETKSPSSISRYNRQRSVTVLAQPKAGISLGKF